MILRALLACALVTATYQKVLEESALAERSQYDDGTKTSIPMSAKDGVELMQHWMDQAFSGLMAAVATKKLANLKPEYRKKAHECNKKAHSVEEHADCVVLVLDMAKDPAKNIVNERANQTITIEAPKQTPPPKLTQTPKLQPKKRKAKLNHLKLALTKSKLPKIRRVAKFSGKSREAKGKKLGVSRKRKTTKRKRRVKKILKSKKKVVDVHDDGLEDFYAHHRVEKHDNFDESLRRAKRSIHNRDHYSLRQKSDQTPLGIISRQVAAAVRKMKGKDDPEVQNWRTVIYEIMGKAKELKMREKMRRMMDRRNNYYRNAGKEADEMDVALDPHRALAMPVGF
ncbi:unnamed protein product, partial [Mesorhabditis spiculigera]